MKLRRGLTPGALHDRVCQRVYNGGIRPRHPMYSRFRRLDNGAHRRRHESYLSP